MNNEEQRIIVNNITDAGMHLHAFTEGEDLKDAYKSYSKIRKYHMRLPSDTHYVMDGAAVVFIGDLTALLRFAYTLNKKVDNQ